MEKDVEIDKFNKDHQGVSSEDYRLWLEEKKAARNSRNGMILLGVIIVPVVALLAPLVINLWRSALGG